MLDEQRRRPPQRPAYTRATNPFHSLLCAVRAAPGGPGPRAGPGPSAARRSRRFGWRRAGRGRTHRLGVVVAGHLGRHRVRDGAGARGGAGSGSTGGSGGVHRRAETDGRAASARRAFRRAPPARRGKKGGHSSIPRARPHAMLARSVARVRASVLPRLAADTCVPPHPRGPRAPPREPANRRAKARGAASTRGRRLGASPSSPRSPARRAPLRVATGARGARARRRARAPYAEPRVGAGKRTRGGAVRLGRSRGPRARADRVDRRSRAALRRPRWAARAWVVDADEKGGGTCSCMLVARVRTARAWLPRASKPFVGHTSSSSSLPLLPVQDRPGARGVGPGARHGRVAAVPCVPARWREGSRPPSLSLVVVVHIVSLVSPASSRSWVQCASASARRRTWRS